MWLYTTICIVICLGKILLWICLMASSGLFLFVILFGCCINLFINPLLANWKYHAPWISWFNRDFLRLPGWFPDLICSYLPTIYYFEFPISWAETLLLESDIRFAVEARNNSFSYLPPQSDVVSLLTRYYCFNEGSIYYVTFALWKMEFLLDILFIFYIYLRSSNKNRIHQPSPMQTIYLFLSLLILPQSNQRASFCNT